MFLGRIYWRWVPRTIFSGCTLASVFFFVGQMGRINAAPDSPQSNSSEQGSLLTEISEDIKIVTIVEGLIGARGIAVQPNGQTIFVTNSISGEILAYDASESTRRWVAVSAPAQKDDVVAVACLDSSAIAVLAHIKNDWFIRTHRLEPPGTSSDGALPLQTVPLKSSGTGDAQSAESSIQSVSPQENASVVPSLSVSLARNWFVICGLPPPLPSLVRGAIGGVRLGKLDARSRSLREERPFLAIGSPREELVLFFPLPNQDSTLPEVCRLTFFTHNGAFRLLSLDTSLESVSAATFCRKTGVLWSIAGSVNSTTCPRGIWRIDAALRAGEQITQSTCVAKMDAAKGLACLSDGSLIAICNTPGDANTHKLVKLHVTASPQPAP